MADKELKGRDKVMAARAKGLTKKPETKKCILYDSIYIMYKCKQS